MASPISRRALLLAPGALAACGRRKATGYPGFCFVAAQESRSLAVIDLSSFRMRRPIRLEAAASAIVPHPHLPKAFALAPDAGILYEVDGATLTVTRRARLGGQAVGMLLGGNALWLLFREPATLVEVPLDSFAPRRRIRLSTPPDDFDIVGARAAIASRTSASVLFADLQRGSLERTVSVPRDTNVVRFQQKGDQVIAGSPADRSVSILDAQTGALIVRLPLAIEPRHFCFTSDGGQIFVSGPGKDAVAIVYPYRTEVGETILAGRAPDAMAVAGPTGGPYYLLVANPQTNTITALDIDTRRLAAVVSVGREPRHILITPDNQYALVLNERSGDLAVIRIASLTARHYKSAPLFTMLPVGDKPVSAGVVTLA
jgi:DNA-binding beta-propeller fold protein YncE